MFEDVGDRLSSCLEEPLEPVSTAGFLSAWAAAGAVILVELMSGESWVPILDSLNLVFHEAGHPLFGIFGHTIGFLGGTLMQLLVPLLVTGACWGKRQAAAIGLGGFWFFQNFLNIARYMADARTQELPLVGGGEHDWGTLFGQWGLLAQDTAIAKAVALLGWIGMGSCLAWILWRWLRDRSSARAGR